LIQHDMFLTVTCDCIVAVYLTVTLTGTSR
jgi:hypothetical protein